MSKFLRLLPILILCAAVPAMGQADKGRMVTGRAPGGQTPVGQAPTAQPAKETPAAPAGAEDRMHIVLSGVNLHAVVQYVSLYSGKPVILPGNFPGDRVVDVVSGDTADVPVARAMSIFASVLRNYGFAMIETENFLHIVSEANVGNVPVRDGIPTEGLAAETLVTIVYDLKHADAKTLLQVLNTLKSKAGTLLAPEGANRLVMTDYGPTLSGMLDVVRRLDVEPTGAVVDRYKVENTSVDAMMGLARSFINNLKAGAGPVKAKRLETLAAEQHSPTNSFILYGYPEDIARVKEHLARFDVKPEKEAQNYHSYAVLHRDAKELKSVLDALFASTSSEKDLASGGRAIITADEVNNEMIVTATPARYEQVLSVIKKLDRPSAQVVIESAMVELNLDKLFDLGVELGTIDKPGDSMRGFAGTTFDLSTITADGREILVPTSGGLTGGIFKDSAFQIPALVQLAQKDSDVSLIISPSVMTRDNREARILIAEEREYAKREYSPEGETNVITSGGYNDAKVELNITPHINVEGTVRLNIHVVIQQFLPSTEVSGIELTNKTSREAETEVTVPDGYTVVIGGLTSNVMSDSVSKVPILGDIPGLGFLFRRTSKTNEKRNLCVFITPHIFRTVEELRDEAERRKTEMHAASLDKDGESVLPLELLDKVTGGNGAKENE